VEAGLRIEIEVGCIFEGMADESEEGVVKGRDWQRSKDLE
jgi:hypothetical protein